MHNAYNGRLPSTLINCIVKKRDLSYRERDSLLVPRFNSRFMKEGGKFLKKLWCCVGGSITR